MFYEGQRDHSSRFHGRGTLYYAVKSAPEAADITPRYEGRFLHGCRDGKGTMYFEDGSWLSGNWKEDELNGPGVYYNADGSWLEGVWVDGSLSGAAKECDFDGKVSFIGEYYDGVRNGFGRSLLPDGSELRGHWVNGQLHDTNGMYIFPRAEGNPDYEMLVGIWRRNVMKTAWYVKQSCEPCGSIAFEKGHETFEYENPSNIRIAKNAFQSDPYERDRVYVSPSPMPGAGEGLFAKRRLLAGEITAFYSGIRITHAEVDNRDWSFNNNTLSLDEDTVIDVPSHFSSTSQYCASLGHKANHGPNNNAIYDHVFHPRFGHIKCVRAIKNIEPGEEILVDYGYDLNGKDGVPDWYRHLCANTKMITSHLSRPTKRPLANGIEESSDADLSPATSRRKKQKC